MVDKWREKPSEELINACDKRVDPLREATYYLNSARNFAGTDIAREELKSTKVWIIKAKDSIPLFSEQAAIFISHVEELEPLVDKPHEFEERLEQLSLMLRMIDFYMNDFVSCLCGR